MILRCEFCNRKISTELKGTIRGKGICDKCLNILLKIPEVLASMLIIDNNYSSNQDTRPDIYNYVVYNKSCAQSPEKPSSTISLRSRPIERRTTRQIIEYNQQSIYNQQAKKEIKSIQCPKAIQEIIDFWHLLGLHQTQPDTKTYNENIRQLKKALRGTLSCCGGQKFTRNEIKLSITNFHLAATDPNYTPPVGSKHKQNLSRMSLSYFIYYPYGNVSYMIEYLEKPKLVEHAEREEDEHPEITKYFVSFYIRETLGGVRPKNGFSQMDMQNFITASKRTVEFFKEHKSKMNLHLTSIYNERGFAKLICESLEHSTNGELDKLSPGWFSSDAMFNKRLPTFLFREGILEDRRDF